MVGSRKLAGNLGKYWFYLHSWRKSISFARLRSQFWIVFRWNRCNFFYRRHTATYRQSAMRYTWGQLVDYRVMSSVRIGLIRFLWKVLSNLLYLFFKRKSYFNYLRQAQRDRSAGYYRCLLMRGFVCCRFLSHSFLLFPVLLFNRKLIHCFLLLHLYCTSKFILDRLPLRHPSHWHSHCSTEPVIIVQNKLYPLRRNQLKAHRSHQLKIKGNFWCSLRFESEDTGQLNRYQFPSSNQNFIHPKNRLRSSRSCRHRDLLRMGSQTLN